MPPYGRYWHRQPPSVSLPDVIVAVTGRMAESRLRINTGFPASHDSDLSAGCTPQSGRWFAEARVLNSVSIVHLRTRRPLREMPSLLVYAVSIVPSMLSFIPSCPIVFFSSDFQVKSVFSRIAVFLPLQNPVSARQITSRLPLKPRDLALRKMSSYPALIDAHCFLKRQSRHRDKRGAPYTLSPLHRGHLFGCIPMDFNAFVTSSTSPFFHHLDRPWLSMRS